MGFNTTNLTEYVDETGTDLMFQSVTEAPSYKILGKQSGIKHKEALQFATTNIVLQDGSSCGFNASGTDTFAQREIEVCTFKVNMEYCFKKLEHLWTQFLLNAGSDYEDQDLPQGFMEQYKKRINEKVEDVIWQGNASDPACSGVTHHVAAATGVVRVSTGVTYNESNVVAIMKSFISGIPEEIRKDSNLAMFIGQDYFDTYQFEMFNLDKRHIAAEDGAADTAPQTRLLYTNIPVYVVPGLTGTGEIYLTPKWNFIIGTDMNDEHEKFKFWYSKDDDVHRFSAIWKLGTQIAFPEYIVYYNG